MWTMDEQYQFLFERLGEYQTAAAEGRLSHFWVKVNKEWDQKFPETCKNKKTEPSVATTQAVSIVKSKVMTLEI